MNKKNILMLTLALALLLCGCSTKETTPPPATLAPIPTAAAEADKATPTPAPSATAEPAPTGKPLSPEVQALTAENQKVMDELRQRQYMEGRLVIPSAGIDVALFNWGTNPNGSSDPDKDVEAVRQAVVDNSDSALLYYDPPVGNIIADHSTQDFANLTNVKEGDAAYILSGDRIVSLRCDLVTDGVNTGYGITDKDGGWHHEEDYTCYTCLEDWTHIQLVGFTMTDEDFFDTKQSDSSTSSGASTTSSSNSGAGAVATTVSLPAPAATTTPAPSASPAPSATPAPTAAPQNAGQQNAPAQNNGGGQPVINYEPAPSYDAYSDEGYRGDAVYFNGNANGDGYLS